MSTSQPFRAPFPGPFRGVIFDLDGTLLDSLADLGGCMNRVLERSQLPVHPIESYRAFIGDGMKNLVSRALPDTHREPSFVEARYQEMHAEYLTHWADQTAPYPGIPELLGQLEHRGFYLAVLSNKPEDFTPQIVRRFFPNVAFRLTLGAGFDVPRKPDPAGALRIIRESGIPAEAFLYLGDSGTDMETANRAGVLAIGVLWGFRDAGELKSTGAKHLIKSPEELLTILDNHRGNPGTTLLKGKN